MFFLGSGSADITEYTLSTGFDISSVSLTGSFSVNSEEDDPN